MSESPQGQEAREEQLLSDLRIAELERQLEATRDALAATQEELRRAREHSPADGPKAIAARAKAQLADRLRPQHRGRLALASLPTLGAAPQWQPSVDVLTDSHPACFADPPFSASWALELGQGGEIDGYLALRTDAWDQNSGGVELHVRWHDVDGELLAAATTACDPRGNGGDRRWIPWRLALPPASGTLTLQVTTPAGVPGDYAWAVIGDPRISTPGLPAAQAARWRPPRRRRSAAIPEIPVIALLCPVHNPDLGLLERTLSSVFAQTSPHWQLCLTDDGSSDPAVQRRLERAAQEDARVRLVRYETAQGISAATNAAMGLATAPYVATLDHDDLLAPDAIEAVARALAAAPGTDVLYSDNDLVAGSHRFAPALKPDWSPDYLRACMYTLHLGVYRRALVEQIGGWRSEFDGAQDHDLLLRLSEQTDQITHLPRVLAHWRAHAGSAALGELAKPQAYERGRAAVAAHLERTGHPHASVERLPQAGRYRVRHPLTRPVRVILPVRDGDDPAEIEAAAVAWQAQLGGGSRVERLQLGAIGLGARLAGLAESGDGTLLLLSAAMIPSDGLVEELGGHVQAGAGAAGGVVIGADGQVLAGGVAFPAGLPAGLHLGEQVAAEAPHPSLTMVTNRLAVDGVVAVEALSLRRAARERRVAAADRLALAALTLALAESGGRVVWSPHAVATAGPSAAARLRRTTPDELALLDRGQATDPYWNPLLWVDAGSETVPVWLAEDRLLDEAGP